MMHDRKVVVTGIGPLASPGIGKEAFWQGILDKHRGLGMKKIALDEENWAEFPAHMIENFHFGSFNLDQTALSYMKEWKEEEPSADLCYLIAAAALAIEDSNLKYDAEDNEIGLVLTHENMGLMPFLLKLSRTAYDTLTKENSGSYTRLQFYEKLYRDGLKRGYDVQSFMTLFHVAKIFNIHNYSLFINNACASGLYALETASHMIQCGQCRAVVVAASDNCEIYKYLWFRDIGLYADNGKIKPFCRDSSGLVFGDGGVALILEDLEHARNRNAPIYAEYLGGGFSIEGWKVTTPQIGSTTYQKALLKALKRSNISNNEIDLLVPHGVGSPAIDYYEAKAITDVFGVHSEKPLITAFKPYVGHNLGGSALLETAILLLAMKHETIIPTLNCDNINPDFNISLVTEQIDGAVDTAMKICCAFAGYNAAVIFRRPE
jgi:3-oxoacyl-[acyl-carrier-protein] synthase II